MDIVKHTPEPTPPPATYDLTGLTEDELRMLRDILGGFRVTCKTHELFVKMDKALGWSGRKYETKTTEMGRACGPHSLGALYLEEDVRAR